MAVMIATIVIIVVTEFVKFGNKFLWSRKNDWDYNKDENARRYIAEKYARQALGEWVIAEMNTVKGIKDENDQYRYLRNVLLQLENDTWAGEKTLALMVKDGLFIDANITTSEHDTASIFYKKYPYALDEVAKTRNKLLVLTQGVVDNPEEKFKEYLQKRRKEKCIKVAVASAILLFIISKI